MSFDSPSNSLPKSSIKSLKDEYDDKQTLEKTNFDLKMKIYYLEEKLNKLTLNQDDSVLNNNPMDNHSIASLKLLLEEKDIELEQRNQLLIKAKTAIEHLKKEIDKHRNNEQTHYDLEDRIQKIKNSSEMIENEHKKQTMDYEIQISNLRQMIFSKEKQCEDIYDKYTSLEIKYEETYTKLIDTNNDIDTLQEHIEKYKRSNSELEEEISQLKAHTDIYKIQMNEHLNEANTVKDKLSDLQLYKDKLEEKYTNKINDLENEHDIQLRNLRNQHSQEIERLSDGHMKIIDDIREMNQRDMNKLKADIDTIWNDIRKSEQLEYIKVKEDLTIRLHNKTNEFEDLNEKYQLLIHKNELVLLDNSHYQNKINELNEKVLFLSNSQNNYNEISTNLTNYINKYNNSNSLYNDLLVKYNDIIKQNDNLSNDMNLLLGNNKNLHNQLLDYNIKENEIENLNHNIKDLNNHIHELKNSLKNKDITINELNNQLDQLTNDINESNNHINDLKLIINNKNNEIEKINLQFTNSNNEISKLNRNVIELNQIINSKDIFINELKESLNNKDVKLNEYIDKFESINKLYLTNNKSIDNITSSYNNIIIDSYYYMNQWDNLLNELLDGNLFDDLNSYSDNKSYTNLYNRFIDNRVDFDIRSSNKKSIRNIDTNIDNRFVVNNKKDSYSTNELENLLNDPSNNNIEKILQKFIISIEHINSKIERINKLKLLFYNKSNSLLSSTNESISHVTNKITLLHNIIDNKSQELLNIKNIINRDNSQRELELNEMRSFRETILNDHNSAIKQSEFNLLNLQNKFSQLENDYNILLDKYNKQSNILDDKSIQLQDLQLDIQQYQTTEKIINELNYRLVDLSTSNENLISENKIKNSQLVNNENQINSLMNDNISLSNQVNILSKQLDNKDMVIDDLNKRLYNKDNEINILQSKQMNPLIEKSIYDTQALLSQSTSNNNTNHSNSDSNSNVNKSTNSSIDSYIVTILQLLEKSELLIVKSKNLLITFEELVLSTNPINTSIYSRSLLNTNSYTNNYNNNIGNNEIIRIKEDINELLELNSNVTIELNKLIVDVKKYFRNQVDNNNSNNISNYPNNKVNNYSVSKFVSSSINNKINDFSGSSNKIDTGISFNRTLSSIANKLSNQSINNNNNNLPYQVTSSVSNILSKSINQSNNNNTFSKTNNIKDESFISTNNNSYIEDSSYGYLNRQKNTSLNDSAVKSTNLSVNQNSRDFGNSNKYNISSKMNINSSTSNNDSKLLNQSLNSMPRFNKISNDLFEISKKLDALELSRSSNK